ncbi:MAG: Sensor histidine kinase YpdA [Firmicutes bacterium ADurb.Bin193]|nr:MAG: Sensor histidine kinase YpdA [Firmicutes bacterium ADurb.Bin193]
MKLYKNILLLFILLMPFVLSGCQVSQDTGSKSNIYIENGELNLSDWDSNKDGNIKLDGQWEFYWNQLLTYDNIQTGIDTTPIKADVPHAWTEYSIDGQKLPGQGYGTYRLHVKTSLPINSLLSFKANTFSSAYKLFVNDSEIASNGEVGISKERYRPQYKPLTAVFNIPASEFDVIIQVANYDFCKGGFWNSLLIGSVNGIAKYQEILIGKKLFVAGALVILALYYFSIFYLRRIEKKYLYFALVCYFAIFVFDTNGELIISKLFPGIPFSLLLFIWHASAQLSAAVFVLYVEALFPTRFNKVAARIYSAISLALILLFMLTSAQFYTKFGRITDYIMFSGAVAASIGFIKKMKGGVLYLIALSVPAITITYDILLNQNVISSDFGELSSFGILIFLFVHTIIHASLFKEQFDEKERLLIEVEATRDEAIQNEIKFLQAQIKPHFLYNTLSVIASMVTRNPNKARQLIEKFGDYLRNSFDFDSNDNFVSLDKALELVNAYVEIEKARFRDRIQFVLNCDEIPEVRIPRLSIQPLVENAIRHGILKKSTGGTVTVNIKKEAENIRIEVSDDGVGMSSEEKEKLLEASNNVKGVGVKNIQRRLEKLYGQGLVIESNINKGTTISFEIPLK